MPSIVLNILHGLIHAPDIVCFVIQTFTHGIGVRKLSHRLVKSVHNQLIWCVDIDCRKFASNQDSTRISH